MRILQVQRELVQSAINQFPDLGGLIFQGKSLDFWVSESGHNSIKRSFSRRLYDEVSARHGITRLSLDGYTDEVIWDYDYPIEKVCFEDSVVETLESCAPGIIQEIRAIVGNATKFPDSDALTNDQGLWSFLPFFSSGSISEVLQESCPLTVQTLTNLTPNQLFGFTFISILSGQSIISPHRGSTSLRQRYHLGITVPDPGKAKIRVGDSWIPWEEGKAFGFNDSIEHEVVNDGNSDRVALIVDLWPKKLPSKISEGLLRFPEVLDFCVVERAESARGKTALND